MAMIGVQVGGLSRVCESNLGRLVHQIICQIKTKCHTVLRIFDHYSALAKTQ